MPPSGYCAEARKGYATARRANFAALQREVDSGKHASIEAGAAFEIEVISKAHQIAKLDDFLQGTTLSNRGEYKVFLERRRSHPKETVAESIEFTVKYTDDQLRRFHLEENGEVVDRID